MSLVHNAVYGPYIYGEMKEDVSYKILFSEQLGTRLENLEDLLEVIFGPNGVAGGNIEAWFAVLVKKVQQMFTIGLQDFTHSHERNKRSYSHADVTHLLDKVSFVKAKE